MSETRLADFGPRYRETPPDPALVTIAEPFNTVTASLFLFLALFQLVRLRGQYARFPFLTSCVPILLAGGIGGTLYHALRNQPAYFLLDVIPINILALAASISLTVRLGRVYGRLRTILMSVGVVLATLLVNLLLFQTLPVEFRNLRINMSYLSLAVVILIPLALVLIRSRFRYGGWVFGALLAFAQAWFFRLIDSTALDPLPMGTHWLWHLFGAITTAALAEYFYRLEGEDRGRT